MWHAGIIDRVAQFGGKFSFMQRRHWSCNGVRCKQKTISFDAINLIRISMVSFMTHYYRVMTVLHYGDGDVDGDDGDADGDDGDDGEEEICFPLRPRK